MKTDDPIIFHDFLFSDEFQFIYNMRGRKWLEVLLDCFEELESLEDEDGDWLVETPLHTVMLPFPIRAEGLVSCGGFERFFELIAIYSRM